jgi:hypothetical protein
VSAIPVDVKISQSENPGWSTVARAFAGQLLQLIDID